LRAVCNTSPLILLAKIHRLALLKRLYDEVIVPQAVLKELEARPATEEKGVRALLQGRKLHLKRASKRALREVPAELGRGEREAIALALESKADLVILDDRQGRRVARAKGLAVTGTLGLLIEAREKGLIPSVRRELDRLIEAGIWIDEAFYHRILQEFGE